MSDTDDEPLRAWVLRGGATDEEVQEYAEALQHLADTLGLDRDVEVDVFEGGAN